MRISKGAKEFLNYVKKECKKRDIKLILHKKKRFISGEFRCTGYFNEYDMEIGLALGIPEKIWLPVLAHEFSHSEQYLKNCKAWQKIKLGDFDKGEMFDMWISGKVELSKKQLNQYTQAIIDLEIDCEKRTVEKIKKFNLPVNIDEYIQGAMSYIWMYKVMAVTRKWCKKSPYKFTQITEKMPNKFPKNPYVLSKERFNLIKKYTY